MLLDLFRHMKKVVHELLHKGRCVFGRRTSSQHSGAGMGETEFIRAESNMNDVAILFLVCFSPHAGAVIVALQPLLSGCLIRSNFVTAAVADDYVFALLVGEMIAMAACVSFEKCC